MTTSRPVIPPHGPFQRFRAYAPTSPKHTESMLWSHGWRSYTIGTLPQLRLGHPAESMTASRPVIPPHGPFQRFRAYAPTSPKHTESMLWSHGIDSVCLGEV